MTPGLPAQKDLRAARYVKACCGANAFCEAAKLVEGQIHSRGLKPNDSTPVGGPGSLPNGQVWEALKTASHFNLGISLELVLKSLLILNNLKVPTGHKGHIYVGLYDQLKEECREMATPMDQCYERAIKEVGGSIVFVQLATAPRLPGSEPPELPVPDPNTLRKLCLYLSEEMKMAEKRYSHENVGLCQPPRHYLEDLRVLFVLVRELLDLSLGTAQQAGLI